MDGVLVAIMPVARMLNMSTRRVRQLVKEGILPEAVNHQYDLVECGRAYLKYLEDKAGLANKGKDTLDNELRSEQILHERSKRKRSELIYKEMERQMHRSEDVERIWGDMAMAFKAKVLAMPSKLAPQLQYLDELGEIQTVIRREVETALTELSEYDPGKFSSKVKVVDDAGGDKED